MCVLVLSHSMNRTFYTSVFDAENIIHWASYPFLLNRWVIHSLRYEYRRSISLPVSSSIHCSKSPSVESNTVMLMNSGRADLNTPLSPEGTTAKCSSTHNK